MYFRKTVVSNSRLNKIIASSQQFRDNSVIITLLTTKAEVIAKLRVDEASTKLFSKFIAYTEPMNQIYGP